MTTRQRHQGCQTRAGTRGRWWRSSAAGRRSRAGVGRWTQHAAWDQGSGSKVPWSAPAQMWVRARGEGGDITWCIRRWRVCFTKLHSSEVQPGAIGKTCVFLPATTGPSWSSHSRNGESAATRTDGCAGLEPRECAGAGQGDQAVASSGKNACKSEARGVTGFLSLSPKSVTPARRGGRLRE